MVPDSPAVKAGHQEEDVIVRLDDVPIGNTGELSKFLIAHPPGETVTVVFFRGNEERITQITLGKSPTGWRQVTTVPPIKLLGNHIGQQVVPVQPGYASYPLDVGFTPLAQGP